MTGHDRFWVALAVVATIYLAALWLALVAAVATAPLRLPRIEALDLRTHFIDSVDVKSIGFSPGPAWHMGYRRR